MADLQLPEKAPETVPTNADETRAQLTSLKASATKEYSLKNYSTAAEYYSEATELQASLNGEMSPDNADLLYAYGRCLYHVAVSKSDVLGGKVAGEEPKKKKRKTQAANGASSEATLKNGEEKLAEEIVEAAVEDKAGQTATKEEQETANKPFFQITGDENWTDSEGEDAEDGPEGEADDEEDDDFAIAYEILDVARVLLTRKRESLEQHAQDSAGKGKAKKDDTLSPEARTITERLADTHDLQAEISLENERFTDAVLDSRSALELKQKLFPQESSLIAEAHFKLSLALEFASVTTIQADGEAIPEDQEQPTQVDEAVRGEAAEQMESAIASCKLRVAAEKASLAALDEDKRKEKEKSIKDVEEMVADMDQRLLDLRNPAVNLNGVTGPAGAPDGSNPLGGLLGSLFGESATEQKNRIAEATKGANDLTGLIRHKKQPKSEPKDAATAGAAKRKLDEEVDGGGRSNGKKAKTEDDAAS